MTDEQLEQLSKPELIVLLKQLLARMATLERQMAQLRDDNAQLKTEIARLKKDSSTSSKPPSSDIVKPSSPPQRRKRKIGGQPGHAKHDRAPFAPEQIDKVWEYALSACPDCGGALKGGGGAAKGGRVVQQIELTARPVCIFEHRALVYWCDRCRVHHQAPLPLEVTRAGLIGPRLTALVAYLKGACHASYATIQTYLRDVMQIKLSTGQIARLIGKTSAALHAPYEQLLEALPQQEQLNIDETGHKERGKRLWTWCFRTQLFTMFRIDLSRGSDVLIEVLGKAFAGVIGADYFSAYRKYMGDFNVLVQFCLAHLIRDVKFLTTLSDRVTKNYGQRLLDQLRRMFAVIHRRASGGAMTPERFQSALHRARKAILAVAKRAPRRVEAQNIADRFRSHGDAYFRFITTPGIAPTNNLAERAIRFVVIDRKVTQGTRGDAGRRWCERIWTTIASCGQQGRSVFEFLERAIQAHFARRPIPSLLCRSP